MSARGDPLELAPQVLAQVADLDLVDLGIGLRRFDHRGGKLLVGLVKVTLGRARIAAAAQVERVLLDPFCDLREALALLDAHQAPAAVEGARQANPERRGDRVLGHPDEILRSTHMPMVRGAPDG